MTRPSGIYLFIGGYFDGQRKLVERLEHVQLSRSVKQFSITDVEKIMIDPSDLLIQIENYRLQSFWIAELETFFYVHESIPIRDVVPMLLNGYRQP